MMTEYICLNYTFKDKVCNVCTIGWTMKFKYQVLKHTEECFESSTMPLNCLFNIISTH